MFSFINFGISKRKRKKILKLQYSQKSSLSFWQNLCKVLSFTFVIKKKLGQILKLGLNSTLPARTHSPGFPEGKATILLLLFAGKETVEELTGQ